VMLPTQISSRRIVFLIYMMIQLLRLKPLKYAFYAKFVQIYNLQIIYKPFVMLNNAKTHKYHLTHFEDRKQKRENLHDSPFL
ncbi:MAG: hypothetical protein J1F25_07700, partial [Prevotellaceae bacterium]|nr:hypothetical protein [Prevotellaceae bacterium]